MAHCEKTVACIYKNMQATMEKELQSPIPKD